MAFGKDSVSLIIDSQKTQLLNVKKMILCTLNLDSQQFSLETQDYDIDRIYDYLPGFTKGTSHNFSPAIAIKTSKNNKEKQFSKLSPEDMLTDPKIKKFHKFDKNTLSPVYKFGIWFNENLDKLEDKLYEYYEETYLKNNKKGELVIDPKAPRHLFFYFKHQEQEFFPGENDEFRKTYLKIKETSQDASSPTKEIDEYSCCLVCGEMKKDLLKLEKCKFYDFYSLDQLSFQLDFSIKTNQAMICKQCEEFFRNGYNIANSLLRFSAYQIQISVSKKKYIDHIILPLTSNPKLISEFIKFMQKYRDNIFLDKEKTFKKKIEGLNNSLKNINKKQVKLLKNDLKKLELEYKKFQSNDKLDASKWLNENYFDILQEAAKEGIGLVDLYFEEITAGTSKKKVVYDLLIGTNARVSQIVKILNKTDNYFQNKIHFEFGKLINAYGEKIGKKVIQRLFDGSKMNVKELYRAAYKNIYSDFRELIKKGKDNVDYNIRFGVYEGPKIFHYTLKLLNEAKTIQDF